MVTVCPSHSSRFASVLAGLGILFTPVGFAETPQCDTRIPIEDPFRGIMDPVEKLKLKIDLPPAALNRIPEFDSNLHKSAIVLNQLLSNHNATDPHHALELAPTSLADFRSVIQEELSSARDRGLTILPTASELLSLMWNETHPKGHLISTSPGGDHGPFQIAAPTAGELGLNTYNPTAKARGKKARFDPTRWQKSVYNPRVAIRAAIEIWNRLGTELSTVKVTVKDGPMELQFRGDRLTQAIVRAYNEGPAYFKLAAQRAAAYQCLMNGKCTLDLNDPAVISRFIYIGDARAIAAACLSTKGSDKKLHGLVGAACIPIIRRYEEEGLLTVDGIRASQFKKKRSVQFKGKESTARTALYLEAFLKSREVFEQYEREYPGVLP